MSEVLIQAQNVSKKFCRSLKRSFWYGIKDVLHSLNPCSSAEYNLPNLPTSLNNLRKDEFWALKDVNFEVRRGECLGLIGHNGAGKSTLLKMLNGLIRPDLGKITMRGRIGAMIELSAGFNNLLTGRENIYNQAALIGFTQSEVRRKFDDIVDFSEISSALDMPLQNYSSGMRVRLGFSIFAHLEPDILLIDEVLAVGDVGFRMKSLNKMSEIMSRCAVVFVTHSMPQIFRICNEVMLLSHGVSKFQGRDVAQGVASYFQEFPGGEQTITGSGDCRINSLRAHSPNCATDLHGNLNVAYGDDVSVEVALALGGGHKSGYIQLLFWNMELLPIMDVMTDQLQGFRFEADSSGRAFISCSLRNVVLNAGKYNLSIIVLSDDQKVLCRHDNAISLTVSAKCSSGASIIVAGEWCCNHSSPAQKN